MKNLSFCGEGCFWENSHKKMGGGGGLGVRVGGSGGCQVKSSQVKSSQILFSINP